LIFNLGNKTDDSRCPKPDHVSAATFYRRRRRPTFMASLVGKC
jgi:hypothetical protein